MRIAESARSLSAAQNSVAALFHNIACLDSHASRGSANVASFVQAVPRFLHLSATIAQRGPVRPRNQSYGSQKDRDDGCGKDIRLRSQ